MFENIGKAVDKLNEWKKPEVALNINLATEKIMEILLDVPGMTVCNANHFDEAMPIFKTKEGTVVKLYRNVVGVEHIFLGDNSGKMIFGGYVLWHYSEQLKAAVKKIRTEFK